MGGAANDSGRVRHGMRSMQREGRMLDWVPDWARPAARVALFAGAGGFALLGLAAFAEGHWPKVFQWANGAIFLVVLGVVRASFTVHLLSLAVIGFKGVHRSEM